MDDDLLAGAPAVRSPRWKLIVVVLGGLFVLFGGLALLLSGSDASPQVKKAYALSSEISRIAGLVGNHDSASSTNKHLASTMEAVYASYVAQLKQLPGGKKVDKSYLAQYRDDDIEATLEAAKQQNSFNEAFVSLMILKLDELLPVASDLVGKVDSGIDRTIAEALYQDSQLFAGLLQPSGASASN